MKNMKFFVFVAIMIGFVGSSYSEGITFTGGERALAGRIKAALPHQPTFEGASGDHVVARLLAAYEEANDIRDQSTYRRSMDWLDENKTRREQDGWAEDRVIDGVLKLPQEGDALKDDVKNAFKNLKESIEKDNAATRIQAVFRRFRVNVNSAAHSKALEAKKQRQIMGGSVSASCFVAMVATLIYAKRNGIIAEVEKDGLIKVVKRNKKLAAFFALSLSSFIGSGVYALTA